MKPLKIAITCYPSIGGSGVLATSLGEALARRGHEIHFISYERPFRLAAQHGAARFFFHPVEINGYSLFKYPDYTLPLSVKMAEVSEQYGLDILHVHYAVPHATAAILARSMLPARAKKPAVVTTLHGTDTTYLAREAGYAPAIRHALLHSDAVTAVSHFLRDQTRALLQTQVPISVIHNFFEPRKALRSRAAVRRELGVGTQTLILHVSNLRPVKRIDLLLETASRIRPREAFKLLILAGESFAPFMPEVRRLGLEDRLIVHERPAAIEEYLRAADLGLFTSESESFCLAILELMRCGRPSVATRVGGIPEVVRDGETGVLVASADAGALARAVEALLGNKKRRGAMGRAAERVAREQFSAGAIVPQYEALYRQMVRRRRP